MEGGGELDREVDGFITEGVGDTACVGGGLRGRVISDAPHDSKPI